MPNDDPNQPANQTVAPPVPVQIEFNLDKLKANLEAAARAAAERREGFEDSAPLAWLPEGAHTMRFFSDPQNELYRQFLRHKITLDKESVSCICPNFLRSLGQKEVPECEICKIAKDKENWRLNPKTVTLAWARVYSTTNASQNFDKNNTYVVMYNSFLGTSLLSFVTNLLQAPGADVYLRSILDPSKESPALWVNVKRGGINVGGVNITQIPVNTYPAIEVGAWYKSLYQVIPNTYDADRYKAALALVYKQYEEAEHPGGLPQQPQFSPAPPGASAPTWTAPNASPPWVPGQPATSNVTQFPTPNPQQLDAIQRKIAEDRARAQQAQQPAQPAPPPPPMLKFISKSGREIDLNQPDLRHVIQRQCWKQYNGTDMICVRCPISTDCLVEQMT